MKDKLKNTLEHEVELLGRSISILAIAGLLVVGGASAALLNNFGTVTGDADVNQAITVGDSATDGDEDPTVTSELDSRTFVAGSVATSSHPVENNRDEVVSVEFADTTDESDIETRQVVAERWSVDGSESYNVDVEASEQNVRSGDYSLHFTSGDTDTSDYAVVFYDASVSSGEELTYWGTASGDNPVDDEVWVRESDGETYWIDNSDVTTTGDSENGLQEVSVTLDSSVDWNKVTEDGSTEEDPEFSEVTAVGIGQGSPQAGENYVVDTYIDDVSVAGSSVDEQATQELPVASTGSGDQGVQDIEYRYVQVTPLELTLVPDQYTVSSEVDVPEE
jgi:hypothetical protein